MQRTRVRDFDAEIGNISAVANNAHNPQQGTLDELLPGKVHGWSAYVIGDYSYRRPCLCGWPGIERTTKRATDVELRRHIGRTPQGYAVARTLRRFGRAGNGA